MKRFTFSLEQVLAWRRMQARLESLRWEQIRSELRGIEIQRENLRVERERSAARLQAAGSATGAEFAALDRFRKYVDAEQLQLQQKRVECEKRMTAQAKILAAKEREVKVLEHLRERKLTAWTAQMDRETEQVASEAFLSRWKVASRAARGGAGGPSHGLDTRVNPAQVK